jgi:predicted O-methyltransferase YrrM
MSAVEWLSVDSFRIGTVTFSLSVRDRFKSSSDRFLIVKPRHMVERYEALARSLCPKRIVELGIYQGGSTAFLDLLTHPERLVAVDLRPNRAAALEDFIDENDLHGRVRTYYSFDQADDARLRKLVESEFAGEPIDLVIDDASHQLGPTRASFNVLFPRLRPGGVYVVEDWSALHHTDAALSVRAKTDQLVLAELEEHMRSGHSIDTPLSVLLFEMTLAAAYAPSVFAEIVIADGWAYVVRGPGALDHTVFDLSRVYSDFAGTLIARTS